MRGTQTQKDKKHRFLSTRGGQIRRASIRGTTLGVGETTTPLPPPTPDGWAGSYGSGANKRAILSQTFYELFVFPSIKRVGYTQGSPRSQAT